MCTWVCLEALPYIPSVSLSTAVPVAHCLNYKSLKRNSAICKVNLPFVFSFFRNVFTTSGPLLFQMNFRINSMKNSVEVFALNLTCGDMTFFFFFCLGIKCLTACYSHPDVGKSITSFPDPQLISVFILLSHSQFIWFWVWKLWISSKDLLSSMLFLRGNF